MASPDKTTFALFFGNRGFFPASLMESARAEMAAVLDKLGYGYLMLDADATRHGAVETPAEGRVYADFLKEHDGEFDGVILCLPNFGDETGAAAALKDAGVPILIQAYPDELDKMAPELRRDSFCGKFSIMDVFCQYGIPFTALKPHTVAPSSNRFAENLAEFAATCRVVGGLSDMVVGAIGARTTAFKTVRIDELALQKAGITMETFDLSGVFAAMEALDADGADCRAKAERLRNYADWTGVPADAQKTLTKLGVVFDRMIEEHGLDYAIAVRCWIEMQQQLKVSPCVLLSEINDRPISAACEVDVGNAITMHALRLASGNVSACLDWNNNYGDDDDKCILFHCGPVPQAMLKATGRVVDHAILANAVGQGCGFGCNVGRIAPTPFTFGSMTTEDGELRFFLGEGEFTDDPVPDDFFGAAGVAKIDDLQDVLLHVGYQGFRHHASVTPGRVAIPVAQALAGYLGFEVSMPQA